MNNMSRPGHHIANLCQELASELFISDTIEKSARIRCAFHKHFLSKDARQRADYYRELDAASEVQLAEIIRTTWAGQMPAAPLVAQNAHELAKLLLQGLRAARTAAACGTDVSEAIHDAFPEAMPPPQHAAIPHDAPPQATQTAKLVQIQKRRALIGMLLLVLISGAAYSRHWLIRQFAAEDSLEAESAFIDPVSGYVLDSTIAGHSAGVASVAFFPDGSRLVSAGGDNTVRIWDTATGKELHKLTGHTGWVYAVALPPDGRHIASAGFDQSIRIWNPDTGKQLHKFTNHTGPVLAVSYRSDGTQIVSGSVDKTIRIWDTATGKELHKLTRNTAKVTSVQFSPDGKRIASGSSDGSIRIWDTATGGLVRTETGHAQRVYSVAFRPDGARLASASEDDTIRIEDTVDGRLLRLLTGHSNSVYSVAFRPDGARLASASEDDSIRIWEPDTGELLQKLTGNMRGVYSVAFSADGNRIASGNGDGTIHIWRRLE